MLSIRLQRNEDNLWTIEVLNTGAVISSRRWASQVDALNWTRAVMSSFECTYTVEVIDGKQRIEQSRYAQAKGTGDNQQ